MTGSSAQKLITVLSLSGVAGQTCGLRRARGINTRHGQWEAGLAEGELGLRALQLGLQGPTGALEPVALQSCPGSRETGLLPAHLLDMVGGLYPERA